LMATIAPPAYAGAAVVVPILAPALLLSNMYVFAPGLSIERRTGLIALINVAGAIAIAVLNLVLIPVLGILGSAVADLLGAAAVFTTYLVFSQRTYPVPHDWRALGLALAGTAVAIGAGSLVRTVPVVNVAVAVALVLLALIWETRLGLIQPGAILRSVSSLRRANT
jgi:O-antigen/teichoic acid export membrane protein